jgi:hypothetical protein
VEESEIVQTGKARRQRRQATLQASRQKAWRPIAKPAAACEAKFLRNVSCGTRDRSRIAFFSRLRRSAAGRRGVDHFPPRPGGTMLKNCAKAGLCRRPAASAKAQETATQFFHFSSMHYGAARANHPHHAANCAAACDP